QPLREQGFWREVEHPKLGRYPLASTPIEIDGDRGEQRRAPLLGEHTREISGWAEDHASSPAGRATPGSPPAQPLAGIRVLDLTALWAGPFATRLLVDMGADVIKVEGPAFADPVRFLGPEGTGPGGWNRAPYFNEYSRGKRAISLDLAS